MCAMELSIDPSSDVAPYEQLRTQIALQAASGDLPAGTKLATVRQLAADLGLAANTVARAYRELEADGVIETQGRRGTFVSSVVLHEQSGALSRLAEEYVAAARRLGLTRAEATLLVEQSWSR
jgi:DNA-binding transcriptional regulator YhcF (GntR family)